MSMRAEYQPDLGYYPVTGLVLYLQALIRVQTKCLDSSAGKNFWFLSQLAQHSLDSSGFEPEASALQGQRSTSLSYEPILSYSNWYRWTEQSECPSIAQVPICTARYQPELRARMIMMAGMQTLPR